MAAVALCGIEWLAGCCFWLFSVSSGNAKCYWGGILGQGKLIEIQIKTLNFTRP